MQAFYILYFIALSKHSLIGNSSTNREKKQVRLYSEFALQELIISLRTRHDVVHCKSAFFSYKYSSRGIITNTKSASLHLSV